MWEEIDGLLIISRARTEVNSGQANSSYHGHRRPWHFSSENFAMSEQRYPVGIDLGTTFSAISYVDDGGRVETVRLADNKLCMASAVYFADENDIIVGSEALDFRVVYPDRVARRFKRDMGNPDWTFSVGDRKFRPEELSAMVLRKLINEAQAKIGPIEEVVISVPFIFDAARRQATKNAGQIAGVKVLDIIDEPVAGALAYAHKLLQAGKTEAWEMTELFGDRIILVYDLGGGTFDLTLMKVKPDFTYEVVATAGDAQLGGEDWDDVLEKIIVAKYIETFETNPAADKSLMQDLRIKAVDAKFTLTESGRAKVELTRDDQTSEVIVTRAEFQKQAEALVFRTEMTLQEMMNSKRMEFSSVESVLAIGGSCRMPMIVTRLEHLTKRSIDMSLSPDTAVSQGAALFAAYRKGHGKLKKIHIRTVNPHALGLMVYSRKREKHVNDVLIRSNEPTLTKAKRVYPVAQSAREISLIVLQGDLEDPRDCVKLGMATIPNVPPELLQGAKVVVAFSFQENGLLVVEAEVQPSDGQPPVTLQFDVKVEGSMSEAEVAEAEDILTGITIN